MPCSLLASFFFHLQSQSCVWIPELHRLADCDEILAALNKKFVGLASLTASSHPCCATSNSVLIYDVWHPPSALWCFVIVPPRWIANVFHVSMCDSMWPPLCYVHKIRSNWIMKHGSFFPFLWCGYCMMLSGLWCSCKVVPSLLYEALK